MAIQRVWYNSPGTPDGTSWTTAWQSINDITTLSAGDIVYVHTGTDPHTETKTTENITITGPSSGLPAYVIGVDKTDDSYNISSTNNFITTGSTYDVILDGSLCVFGLRMSSGDRLDINAGDGNEIGFVKDCVFTVSADYLSMSGDVQYEDCTFALGASGYLHANGARGLELINCTITGSNNVAVRLNSGIPKFIGCDFSGHTGTEFVYSLTGSGGIFIGCRIPSSFTISTTGSYTSPIFYGCDSSTNQWRTEMMGSIGGDWAVSTGVYRDSGATFDGSTAYSIKLSANSNNPTWCPVYTDWQTGYIAADSGTQTMQRRPRTRWTTMKSGLKWSISGPAGIP